VSTSNFNFFIFTCYSNTKHQIIDGPHNVLVSRKKSGNYETSHLKKLAIDEWPSSKPKIILIAAISLRVNGLWLQHLYLAPIPK